jgi:uncharacterized membrane protein
MNIWEIDKVFLFLVLVLPGFISIKVYSNLIASDKIDFSKSLIEAICFNLYIYGQLSVLGSKRLFLVHINNHGILYFRKRKPCGL